MELVLDVVEGLLALLLLLNQLLPELDAQVSVWVLVPRAVISWELQALVNTAYSTTHSTGNRVRPGGRSGGSLRDSQNWCELRMLLLWL